MKLAILLATYNSEKYLRIQIDSILAQTFTDFILYIRDDGSRDNTMLILDEYLALYSNITVLNDSVKRRLSLGSFMWMVEEIEADYYMFADHDDYWLSDKIELTLAKMREIEKVNPEKPIVIHTDLKVVDSNLEEICTSFWNYSKIKPSILATFNFLAVYNTLTGCTMLINAKARNVSLPVSNLAIMHDSWIGLNVCAAGGIVDFIPNQTVLYRQHNYNVVGAKEVGTKDYFINKLLFINTILKTNYKRLKMVQQIQPFTIYSYLIYKLLYIFKR